jgi:WhiB family transcriptional regulator, redox-sensing transcriptional regulator
MQWLDRARCLDEDPELFFPVGTTGLALEQIEVAKAVCVRCSVRAECLQWALDTAQDAGVWGGLSEEERRAIRRARRREERAAREARLRGAASGDDGAHHSRRRLSIAG